jgi:hypothetical protein
MSETLDRNTRTHLHLDRSDQLRRLSPRLFAVIVFAFFLPFVTCEGTRVSGVQAATGITPPGSDPAAMRFSSDVIVPDPLALVALLCAGAGVALMALRGRAGPFASALVGIVGLAALDGFVLHAMAEASGRLGIEVGLPLAFLGFLGGVALNDLLLARIPLLEMRDDAGLAQQSAKARRRFAIGGAVIAALLLISAAVTDDEQVPGAFMVALIPVAVLALVALISTIGRFRSAGAAPEGGEPNIRRDATP